jgi:hypothetical protein
VFCREDNRYTHQQQRDVLGFAMAVPDASTISPQKKNSSKNQLEIINKLGNDTANTRVRAAAAMLAQIKVFSSTRQFLHRCPMSIYN